MKRRLLATGLLLVLAVAGVGIFVLWKAKSEVDSRSGVYVLLHIASNKPFRDKEEFDNFRESQKALVRSRLVLNSALREPKVAALTMVQNQMDPVSWLEKNLIVDFPQSPEILRIALCSDDIPAAIAIVDAVSNAYRKEVDYKASNARNLRLAISALEIELEAPERVTILENARTMITP
ncbi:MAG TPA: hypothetical protein VE988_16420 [Gemmataceae bacterium]|nr:hypothetical protein [Gemmataceae bacterium]